MASLEHAENVVLKNEGVRVTFNDYAPSVIKFGRNNDVDTATETVWLTGGDETLPTTNAIDSIVSAEADTSEITLVGHTVADGAFTRVVQTVTLTGTTPVTLGTPLARVERGYISDDTAATGAVTVYEDAADTHLTIPVAAQQSEKCAFTVPADEWLLIQQLSGSILKTSTAVIDFGLQTKAAGGVWRTRFVFGVRGTGSSNSVYRFEAPFLVGPNTDVRMTAEASATNQFVVATIEGSFGLVIG